MRGMIVSKTLASRSYRNLALTAGLALGLSLILGSACTPTDILTGGSSPVVAVHSPGLDRTLPLGEPVALIYEVSDSEETSVSAFYDSDGQADTGDEVIFADSLPTGQNKYAQLLTAQLTPGTLHIGVTAGNSAGKRTAYASGRVTLVDTPQISFTSPAGALRVGAGTKVPVEFNGGVSDFSWRAFYDADDIFNNNEVTIRTGSSNGDPLVKTTFDTSAMTNGTFHVGVVITASSGGTTTAYAPGTVTIVTGAFIQVLKPSVGQTATQGAPVQIMVSANDPGNSTATIRLFYDVDNTFGNGNETDITTISVSGTDAVWNTEGVAPASYWIGAELLNGLTPSLVSYSAGPVQIQAGNGASGGGVSASSLRLLTPQGSVWCFQKTTYRIKWTTNLGPGQGVVTVFREPDTDNDGKGDGAHTRLTIAAGVDATRFYVDLDTTGLMGKFAIGATLTPVEGEPFDVYAPGTITIRAPVFWVGDLMTKKNEMDEVIKQDGPFQGAVFQGVGPKDYLGNTMTTADDYDGDGVKEIVLGAQYGKPFYFSEGGRGAGEAYLIYGNRGKRYSGNFLANSAGSEAVPGVILTGIIPNPHGGDELLAEAWAGTSVPLSVDGDPAPPYATEGLRQVIMIPDQDGDGKGELVFSFPYCNSYSLRNQVEDGILRDNVFAIGRLENNGHFLRGGLVMVSSRNPIINLRRAVSRRLDRVIELHQVGQVFDSMAIYTSWPGRKDSCDEIKVPPDNSNETWIWPCEGFIQNTLDTQYWDRPWISPPRLADPLYSYPWFLDPGTGASCSVYVRDPNAAWLDQIDPPDIGYAGQTSALDDRQKCAARRPHVDKVYCPPGADSDCVDADCISHPLPEGCAAEGQCEQVDPACVDADCTGIPLPAGCAAEGECEQVDPACVDADCTTLPPACEAEGQCKKCSSYMIAAGSGFYYAGNSGLNCDDRKFAGPLEPYGCRILGQETTQPETSTAFYGAIPATTANRFGHSIASSGDFLLIGAPRRTATRMYVPNMPADEDSRPGCGEVYMVQLQRPPLPGMPPDTGSPEGGQPYALPDVDCPPWYPRPHNWIVQDLGFTWFGGGCLLNWRMMQNTAPHNLSFPYRIVGAAANDAIGDLSGVHDLNGDGWDDFLVGGAGTNGGCGAVYLIYRRPFELEGAALLLERLALDPNDDNRLTGLMIIGEPGENLGTSIAGGGPLNDDFNNDGNADALIGSPRSHVVDGSGIPAGRVFILFGKYRYNLMNRVGGETINQLLVGDPTHPDPERRKPSGMLITGVHAGDMVGATVANAGDVNGDGVPDILIAAPEASPWFDSNGDRMVDTIGGLDFDGNGVADDLDGNGLPDDLTHAGLVYLVFGGKHLTGTISLEKIGTPTLPGMVFVGRRAGDRMGGGYTLPSDPAVPESGMLARGVNSAGDLDGDGKADLLLGSVLADPQMDKVDAGEVYVIYGFAP